MKTSIRHFLIFGFRFALLLAAIIIYTINASSLDFTLLFELHQFSATYIMLVGQVFLICLWVYLMCSIALRIIPNKLISVGSRKHFRSSYVPLAGKSYESEVNSADKKLLNKGALLSFAGWAVITATAMYILHTLGILSPGIVVIIALIFGVLDRFFVSVYCPFQRLFMHNRCCTSCRIYNWDFLMMCLPLIVYPSFFSISLAGTAIVAFVIWETAFWKYPQRFSVRNNRALRCSQCTEKICDFKKLN